MSEGETSAVEKPRSGRNVWFPGKHKCITAAPSDGVGDYT